MDTVMMSDLVKYTEQDFMRMSKNKELPIRMAVDRMVLISFKNDKARQAAWRLVQDFGQD